MNLWNPHHPIAELGVNDMLRHHLRIDGILTIGQLDDCVKDKLSVLGYDKKQVSQARTALNKHKDFVQTIEAAFAGQGLTAKQAKQMWPFDLLTLPLTTAQLGYILRWQRDVAKRYGEKEMFCITDGQIFYCTNCPYRDERSNFCGWCMRKLLQDRKAKEA